MKCIKKGFLLVLIAPFYIFMVILIICILMINAYNPILSLNKKIVRSQKFLWYHSTMAAAAPFFSSPIWIKYDSRIIHTKKSFIISNHCSDYDWIYLLALMYHLGKWGDLFLLMKRELGKVPFFGYGIRAFGHILLNRCLKSDKKIIELKTLELNKLNEFVLFMYPEGTYPHNKSIQSSKEFSEKNNIKIDGEAFVPENVLLPRIAGFKCIKEILRFDKIVSMTILLNPYHFAVGDKAGPLQVLLTDKIKISQIMILEIEEQTESDSEFLYRIFAKKDKVIEEFKTQMNEKITTSEQFKKLLDQVSPKKAFDVVEIIFISTKYAILLYIVPLIVMTLTSLKVYAIYKQLF